MKMNKTRLLEKISIQSGISADECSTVLKTFERVLGEELTRKTHRYGGWILLLVALLVSAVAFSQTPQRKARRYRQSGEWLLTGIQNTRYRMQR